MNKTTRPNKTAEYYYKICYMSFLFGMPNFWIKDLRMPKLFLKYYPYVGKFWTWTFYILILFEHGAFVTQKDLTYKQVSDRWIYCMAHPFILMYVISIARQGNEIKNWIIHVLEMKTVYNDPRLEDQMVKKSALTSIILVLSCIGSMTLHSTSALIQVFKSEGTFTTIITAWPSVDEVSPTADAVRIITNLVWWIFIIRVFSSYILVISLTTFTSYQFENLQSYFRSLEGIFQEDLTQTEMELKYEEGLLTGIKLHTGTFVCVNRVKRICGAVLSGQIVFAITILVFLMSQMLRSERTMVNAFATAVTATAVLVGTGFFLLNAGDITIQASHLATAVYCSGWQECSVRNVRVRRLLCIAMARAQKPLVIKGLGLMDLSYQSFLYLVKTSYSVFSVIY